MVRCENKRQIQCPRANYKKASAFYMLQKSIYCSTIHPFRSQTGGGVKQFCSYSTKKECMKMNGANKPCDNLHFAKIIQVLYIQLGSEKRVVVLFCTMMSQCRVLSRRHNIIQALNHWYAVFLVYVLMDVWNKQ